jgi:hypothetical protein
VRSRCFSAFLGPDFRPPRFNFVVESPCLFGARFSVATVQLCRRIALPFWGLVFSRHCSTLSSTRLAFLGQYEKSSRFNFVIESPCLFGAVLSVATVQLSHRLAFLGPGFRPPRFNFVVDSPFWGRAFSHHGSFLYNTCCEQKDNTF